MADRNRQNENIHVEVAELWSQFRRDTIVSVHSLIFLLNGVYRQWEEIGRERQSLAYQNMLLRPDWHSDAIIFPRFPPLRAFPATGEISFAERTRHDGPMMQTALIGWVAATYALWEVTYRTKLSKLIKKSDPDTIRPEQQVLGDLRLIRNNLLHSEIALSNMAGKCKVLKWFKPEQAMVLEFAHVLDFLNQMGWLGGISVRPFTEEAQRSDAWLFVEELTRGKGHKSRLISVRPVLISDDPENNRHLVTVVFDDGVCGSVRCNVTVAEGFALSEEDIDSYWMNIKINDEGGMDVGGAESIPASSIYRIVLEAMSDPGVVANVPLPTISAKRS